MFGARPRWVALGASLALLIGAGGVLTTEASSPGASSFVPITPCRLLDTRPAPSTVGPRSTPVGPDGTMTADAWGQRGNCTIPASATGLAMNVVIASPTAASFLTVWPADQSRPLAASLNWIAGQAPTPNAVTAKLSTTGQLSFYNLAGNVDLIVDVVGFFEPSSTGPAGPMGPAGPQGPAGVKGDSGANGSLNRISKAQIATLRWYQDPAREGTFPTGVNPYGVAFDGTSIWVANEGSNTVSKINPATGTRTDYPTGLRPRGVAFDGTSIWVANYYSNTVSKINPATGAKADYATDGGGEGVAFDGTNIWVTNFYSNTVSKINPNGVAPGTPINYTTGLNPVGVAFDGNNIWVANQGSDTVSKIDPNGVAPGTPINYNTDMWPTGVAFDGHNLWVTNVLASDVTKIDPNGVPSAPPYNYPAGPNPYGVAFDGTNIWVANWFNVTGTASKINPKALPGAPIAYTTGRSAIGIAFDGTSIWVTNRDDNTVSRFTP